jgi:uncharacterized protein (TIGR03546 family)
MLLLTWIRSIYKLLSSDSSPAAIAFGVAFGVLLGCVPLWSGLGMVLLAAMLVFRVQMSSALAAMALGKLMILCGVGTVFEYVGVVLLEPPPLRPLWTSLLNMPVVAWLDLDAVAVTGGAVVGVVVGGVLFWPIRQLVVGYRKFVHEQLSGNPFFQFMTNFWFIKALRFVFIGTGTTP